MELLLLIFITGYVIQHIGSGILIRKILKQQKIAGLTLET